MIYLEIYLLVLLFLVLEGLAVKVTDADATLLVAASVAVHRGLQNLDRKIKDLVHLQ